jgi:rhodanese-related sulfurtransferase
MSSAESAPSLAPLEPPIAYDPKIAVAPEAVTIPKAQEWLKRESVVLIDIRAASTYKTAHIPGAVSIPLGDDIHDGLDVLLRRYTKQTPILLYCDSDACPRSMDAALALINERRYADVRYLEGGYAAWEEAGKPPLMDKK